MFVPVSVQRLGGNAELGDEIVAEIPGSAAPRYAGGLEALSHNLKMLWTSDPNRAQAVRTRVIQARIKTPLAEGGVGRHQGGQCHRDR